MKLRFSLILISLLFTVPGFTQEKPKKYESKNPITWTYLRTVEKIDSLDWANPVVYWSQQNNFAADISEVTYTNWSAGGSNSISFLFNVEVKRTYEKDNVRWQNEFIGKYGLNAEKGRKLRKTDDLLELSSTFGYRTAELSNWFYSAKVNLKTQFDRGYNYPDREFNISRFMAPGYLFSGFGAEYGKNSDAFTIYLSPATLKTTFVYDQRLADRGDFGVTPAVYDSEGNKIKSGRNSKSEFGILITNEYKTEVVKNISFSNRLSLYTDYLEDFGNVDIDWKIEFIFKVNSYISAKLGSHMLFEDHTKSTRFDSEGNEYKGGAKIQWKQQLGVGLRLEL